MPQRPIPSICSTGCLAKACLRAKSRGRSASSRRCVTRAWAAASGCGRSAGIGGMVGGQMLDLAAEGRFGKNDKAQGEQDVLTLQAMKTGAILKFCCIAGAILGHAPKAKHEAASRYGQVIGQAFQI